MPTGNSYLTNAVSSRDDLIEYVLRRLGQPVIQVNVSPQQIQDRINDALDLFYQYHYSGSDHVFITYTITDADVAQGYIQLDNTVLSVVETYKPQNVSSVFDIGIFSPEYQFQMSELYAGGVYRGGNLSYYWMNLGYLNLLSRYFNPDQTFTYNSSSFRLYLQDIAEVKAQWCFVVFRAYIRLEGDQEDSNTDVIGNIYNDRWIKAYATALIQKQWGENLNKYNEVALIGGVKMNGKEILSQAKEEIERLEKELLDKYSYPYQFLMG